MINGVCVDHLSKNKETETCYSSRNKMLAASCFNSVARISYKSSDTFVPGCKEILLFPLKISC